MSDVKVEAASEHGCASSYEDINPLVIDPFGLNAIYVSSDAAVRHGQAQLMDVYPRVAGEWTFRWK
ncbi:MULTISPECIES: hypothetical protein [Paenibacillus]|uniref:hypothetical protein n=1 Tax=Paenibacillus TaxID=44249 RepID=UPI0030DCAD7D